MYPIYQLQTMLAAHDQNNAAGPAPRTTRKTPQATSGAKAMPSSHMMFSPSVKL